MKDESKFDWAAAIIAIASSKSENIGQLARAAELDPLAGDLSDIDLSDLDLSGQDFGGWDLRNAKFTNARLDRTEFRNALVDPKNLVEAVDWQNAELDDAVRAAVEEAAARRNSLFDERVSTLEFSVRTSDCLQRAEIALIGQLVQKSQAELLRLPNFGRKSLNEVREVLGQLGLQPGMNINWPVVTNN